MKVSYPARTKLTRTMSHFRVEAPVYEKVMAISRKYNITTAELSRMGLEEIVNKHWPKVDE